MSDDPWALDTPTSTGTPDLDLDEDQVLQNEASDDEKREALQKILFAAASNGDVDKVHSLLGGEASNFVDVNAKDESGSTALIYSSCFGNEPMVNELLRFDAEVDVQDKNEWTALMWAINNHHETIVKRLLENEASLSLKTSTGRSALDFVSPGSEIYAYMKQNGYVDGDADDFYEEGVEEMDMRMDAVHNLDIKMDALDLDMDEEEEEDDDYDDDEKQFVWERVMPDQMFVFNENDIPKILDEAITNMVPKRSTKQKPIPANIIFLSARYALAFGSEELLEHFLDPVLQRIRTTVMEHKADLTFLAFWISNCTLLMYYIRKDNTLFQSTVWFQEKLSEMIVDIYVLITQDVEARIDKHLDASILDHDTMGVANVQYQSEWRLFRKQKNQLSKHEEVEQTTRPPSPKSKAKPSPRNVTSVLGSVLFIMDLYDVHPIITQQILGQIFYWLGASLFNRIMTNRKYLSRSRAMQIRLNLSAVEDWARTNNRRPENSDEFKRDNEHMSVSEICQQHLTPLIQLLQWLQCFSGFGDDFTNVIATLQQLTKLNPLQLLHVANKYRAEVGERGLSKEYKNYLAHLKQHYKGQVVHTATVPEPREKDEKKDDGDKDDGDNNSKELTQVEPMPDTETTKPTILPQAASNHDDELLMDASVVLAFVVPTLREMIVTYGAGLGGTHKARARKYEPQVPTEFLDKFENDTENDDNHDDAKDERTEAEPLFRDLAMPQPVHKWSTPDPDIDGNVW